ncbi:MAG: UDP-N-acetyl-D-glucosamine 2-epimerase, UDP-hydrolysing [Gammaproteobacteria bacterium RIFCSPLOWO2_02_FULL_42_14]|nr:MAG: UDP-N-acetyl-D-glucosamine 2-epimerase, UDP-hydrolysing [Gammaproteobacteria bacterium RIFCSPHIGHO2_02_FULL_42_43]OGT28563.1 MAG: UDP-N-acetyl-D-glucosamine 2-epimerase, UDP-hydrolysing [Gammaproteobacteria bacterium RIFCSPHIGHO2_01_FULL_42_8]OGT51379.1 MAG: UDP-N-acetyl-D-glucosamine 2-epimerase, UDP-hydrolysing [Gammaproteobacteria bacterium RIFCSPHIGHO2_12_FULL_41_25]OGT62081.1 MAG: UDP-N-acetyl-D-glucosamine 2-epimerase, UDP-hydrolysing [Gammaproteobacteria bacterium RIFCSPLOWO2_02_F
MRKIFIVTERRADYSRFKPILKLIQQDPLLDYDLVVTGLHLKKEHGFTLSEIETDGFKIFSTFEMYHETEDSGAAMVRSFGTAVRDITRELEKSKPDLILSGFDIAANFAVTIAGAHMNIPVAHIQGGEVSGTIDESIRHAMSKFAHYHFVGNQDAVDRLVKMGELPEMIFNVGCPSIDAILAVENDAAIVQRYKLTLPYAVVLQHPVTTEVTESGKQIEKTLNAINELGIDALFILPNNDAGYSPIVKKIEQCHFKRVASLTLHDYVNLLKKSSVLVGNSSSGIHETASLHIPTINIGSRQQGRLRPMNVIDVSYNTLEIKAAIHKCLSDLDFLQVVKKCLNPYGDGKSARKIVELLKKIRVDASVIQKRISY